ncbi:MULTISPECIES: YdgH/BhsA/McbA family protein [Mycobacteroides]|jgi:hypothetical protein|nr:MULTISPECIES: hypothetical protein [Mycobacteroides]MBE5454129.1 hypothetical protein [Mycobacteroides abscessus]MBN7314729.1 hypothetical protein [Mycobacteroides abscessus subsp. abscessus]MCV7308004.1 hypothetical protein [Mycobacteroides immunogenum]SKG54276.1 Uncharacterised protein [Mycobacteroides abscessus subsp. massiliense]
MRRSLLVMISALLSGCSLFSTDPLQADRFVRPDHTVPSPSGEYAASVEYGPTENNVKTWVPVIRDKSGDEVFRDDYPYSTRHMLYVTWLSSQPAELWVYSGDVGTFSIAQQPNGKWMKQHSTAPKEIKDLHP